MISSTTEQRAGWAAACCHYLIRISDKRTQSVIPLHNNISGKATSEENQVGKCRDKSSVGIPMESCLFFNFPALLFHCSRWITLSPPSLLSSSRHRRRLSQPIFALVISTAYMVRNLGAGELFILASWLVGWRHWCGGGVQIAQRHLFWAFGWQLGCPGR